jgi:predicted ATP-grasp superfamily ATP-dependent carboligase
VANRHECVVIGVTEQLTGSRSFGSSGFRYCGNILPIREMRNPAKRDSVLHQVRQLAGFLTREYRLAGANGIDFVLNGDQVCLTEVNPRYSASMELAERGYGLPVFHLHARAILQGDLPEFKLESTPGNETFFGKAILFAERNAVAPDTKRWLDKGIRDVPAAGESLRNGDPVCTLFASRQTYDETLADLIGEAEVLKREMYG